jgi:hypothetical protein
LVIKDKKLKKKVKEKVKEVKKSGNSKSDKMGERRSKSKSISKKTKSKSTAKSKRKKESNPEERQYGVQLYGRTKGEYQCGGCQKGDNFLRDENKRRGNIRQYKHIELDDTREKELQSKGVKKIPYIEECALGPDGKPTSDCRTHEGWDETYWKR